MESSSELKLIWVHGGARVWYANLSEYEAGVFWSLLSQAETQRAHRYGDPLHRYRFIVRRGLLRQILSSVLDRDPRSIEIAPDPSGKPRIPGETGEVSVAFSHDEALFAYSSRSAIGVDIEGINPNVPYEGILAENFTDTERVFINVSPAEQRHVAFFRIWTRKEACAKALGHGLTRPMSAYDVAVDHAERFAVEAYGAALRVTDLPLPASFAGAVAVVEG